VIRFFEKLLHFLVKRFSETVGQLSSFYEVDQILVIL